MQNKLEVYFSCTSAPRFLKGMRAGFLCLQDVYMPKIWIHHSAADSSWGASASIKTQGVKTYNLCFYSKIMWVIASLEAVTSRYSLEMEADFTAFRCGWGYCDPVLVPSLRTTCWLLNKTPGKCASQKTHIVMLFNLFIYEASCEVKITRYKLLPKNLVDSVDNILHFKGPISRKIHFVNLF